MNKKRIIVYIIVLSCTATACTGVDWLVRDHLRSTPTPEESRDAIAELLCKHPPEFMGPLDPDEYAKMPIVREEAGVYRLGIFLIRPNSQTFEARVGGSTSCEAECRGRFERVDCRWVATIESNSISK